jgi:putative SOS response-associated peptidase YedK
MCGRFAAQLPPEFIARLFRTLGELPNLGPNWNVCPTNQALVVRLHPQSGERRLDALTWGLVPHFTADLKKAARPINARAETVRTSSMFRDAFKRRRCLVPADAFYEWQAGPESKQPYAIARVDGAPLAFAGLWEGWRSTTGETLRTFTILTTAANETMRRIHARMPVLLEREAWPVWLAEEAGEAAALMAPAPEGVLRIWPVSRAVNNVRNNNPALLDRIETTVQFTEQTGLEIIG